MKTNNDKLVIINQNVAGIDIGSRQVFVGTEDGMVVNFPTFTSSYIKLIEYLRSKKVKAVVMEATGVYWFSLYRMLEKEGFSLYLVNGYQSKSLPGRKSDVVDCEWLRKLHTYGLLRGSFIPPNDIRILREYNRQRRTHIKMASTHANRMHKILTQMNIRLNDVLSNTVGKSFIYIIEAILQGERNPEKLASFADKAVLKRKRAEILEALQGYYTNEYLFALKQALTAWKFYKQQCRECDKQIEEHLKMMIQDLPQQPPFVPKKRSQKSNNSMEIPQLPEVIYRLTGGKDLIAIVGMSADMVTNIVGEVGIDLKIWPTVKHFVSWLGLSPKKHQSGNINRKRAIATKTEAGQLFRMAAINSKDSVLASFYRRIKSRHGHKVAFKATARKLACIFYLIMTKGVEYVKVGLEEYKEREKIKQIRFVQKKAAQLGMNLVPI